MNKRIATLTLALGMGACSLGACGIAMAQQALTEPQVHSKLTAQGYTKVHDLKFKDGMWHAEAKSANGTHVDVRIDAGTGKVYPDEQVSNLSKHDIKAALETQGYTDVHDVDFDGGLWRAKAKKPTGNKVHLKIDARSGKVIGID
jgi:uncharacterized membrane protein YkoI